jgi:quercetin dioxygenase-like cupin family protein
MTRRTRRAGRWGSQGPALPAVARFDPGLFRWRGVRSTPYKATARGPLAWKGVERFVLVGASGEPTAFHLRYFEIAPGGYSSLERHRHAHAIVVVRGRGRVRLGSAVVRVGPMDLVYIPPEIPHQFRAGREPFGFLCPVDAIRDAPRPAARERLRGQRPRATIEKESSQESRGAR